jgi:hypothetical protein
MLQPLRRALSTRSSMEANEVITEEQFARNLLDGCHVLARKHGYNRTSLCNQSACPIPVGPPIGRFPAKELLRLVSTATACRTLVTHEPRRFLLEDLSVTRKATCAVIEVVPETARAEGVPEVQQVGHEEDSVTPQHICRR